jgi:hypothetical protein
LTRRALMMAGCRTQTADLVAKQLVFFERWKDYLVAG